MSFNKLACVFTLFSSIFLAFSCNQATSFSEESNPRQDAEKTAENNDSRESLVEEFGLLTKLEDEIDWSGLAARLDIKTPPFPDYERLLFDSVSWSFESSLPGLPDTEARVSDLLIQKRYDEAIQKCLESMRESWPFVGKETLLPNVDSGLELQGATSRFRFYLHAYARACELKGEYAKASNLYLLLYGGNYSSTEEIKWTSTRLAFAQKGKDGIYFSPQMLAEYKEVDFNSIVAELEKWVELLNQRKSGANSPDVVFADIILPTQSKYLECRYYAEARRLYVLRDRCAQIVNPRLHFTIDTRPDPSVDPRQPRYRLILLSRASYLTFLDYMEEEYRKTLERLEKAGREPSEKLKAKMEVARQLARLPL
jgi:hypothetical protein